MANKSRVSKSWVGIGLAVFLFGYVMVAGQPTPKKHPERTTVIYWHQWGGEWEKVINKIVDRFNDSQTEYVVRAVYVTNAGADTKFILSTMGGLPPDVMTVWGVGTFPFAAGGLLTDLETLMTPQEKEYFYKVAYPAMRESGQINGKTYNLCIGGNLMGYYVNAEHLRAIGADPDKPPKTFDELVKLGEKLNQFDKNGNLTRMGLSVSSLMTQSFAWGDGFYDAKSGKLRMNTPEQLAALTALVKQKEKIGFDNATRFFAAQNNNSTSGAWPFIAGSVSIALDGPWRVEEIRKYRKEMDYRVWTPIPPEGGKPLAGALTGNFMVIPASAKQKKGAFEFIKFWCGLDNPERAAEFYVMGGWIPLTPDVAKAPLYQKYMKDNPQFKPFIDILGGPNCHAMPAVGYSQFYLDQISRAEDKAYRGSLTPKQALQEMKSKVEEELVKRKELGFND